MVMICDGDGDAGGVSERKHLETYTGIVHLNKLHFFLDEA